MHNCTYVGLAAGGVQGRFFFFFLIRLETELGGVKIFILCFA
jgi:hypothetical protein